MNFLAPKIREADSRDLTLKAFPEDFVVNEISRTREQAGDRALSQILPELGDDQIIFSVPVGEDASAPPASTSAPLSAEVIAQLSMLNSQSREALVSKVVVEASKAERVEVPNMPASKAERRALYDFINNNFPYIRSIDGRDPLTLILTTDSTLRPLSIAGLSMACLDSLAAYLKRGASHDKASAGVRVGRGITKEARTQIYRELAQLPIRLDCKTIDDTHKSSECDVTTCIFVKFRASNKRKRLQDSVKASASCYLRFVICKRDLEHFRLIASLNKALSDLQPGALAFAGIKDKNAITRQFATVTISTTCEDSNERSDVAALLRAKCSSLARRLISLSNHAILSPPTNESGFIVGDLEYVPAPLQSGQLAGNSFRIVLRGVTSEEDTLQRIQAKAALLMQQGGGGGEGHFLLFPNYFGSQRMGWTSARGGGDSLPFGPLVGRCLVLGEHAQAVVAILHSSERKEAAEFKSRLAAGAPLQQVLDAMPAGDAGLDRERSLVRALLRFGCSWPPSSNSSEDDKYRLALQQISYPLRALWVNSFQSWLWNWAASERVLLGTLPIEGDLLLPPDGIEAEAEAEAEAKEGEGPQAGDVCVVVTSDWLSGLTSDQLQEAGRRVVLPLFGTKIRHAKHAVGRAYAMKLETELQRASSSARPLHAMPRGAYRKVFGRCGAFSAKKRSEESIELAFELPSGAFGTSLLRELVEQEF